MVGYATTAFAPVKSALGDVIIPPGDPAEQLIANLLLSVVVCQLHSEAAAQSFITRAYELAVMLASRSVVYRPPQPLKFARVTYELDGIVESVLYSVIGGVLVVPKLAPEAIVRRQPLVHGAVTLLELTTVSYMVRIRARMIAAELEAFKTKICVDELSRVADLLLAKCLQQELSPAEPLDRASESFALAHNLIGMKNYSLAALALHNAADALDSYRMGIAIAGHVPLVQSMKGQIAGMLEQIRHRAM
jgi:hypothetical protein